VIPIGVGQLHNGRNENRWAQFLEKDVRQRLEYRVRHEENRESRIISSLTHVVQTLLQACNLRISDVCSVKEGE
jgi:hypothetical protein